MFTYTAHHIAPQTVEFRCGAMSGRRVIRVYLSQKTPRIMAYNETPAGQTPALLYLDEVLDLVQKARQTCHMEL